MISSLSGTYIDETFQKLVQTEAGEFADGLGNPIQFPSRSSMGVQIQVSGNTIYSGLKGTRHIPFSCQFLKVRAISSTPITATIELRVNDVEVYTIQMSNASTYYDSSPVVELAEDDMLQFYVVDNIVNVSDLVIYLDVEYI